MQTAPLYDNIAKAPDGGKAYWLTASDGVRIRVGVWDRGEKGTVLLFPGRSEYIEKYGQSAGDLQARGYATICIDWRGQGMADRFLDDPATGHVGKFSDYQLDVAAVIKAVDELELPKPIYLLSHSLGGCIALRSLHEGLDVKAAVFSAPMWDIQMSAPLHLIARGLACVAQSIGMGHKYAPGTNANTYVLTAPFAGNQLTTDPEIWAYMHGQLEQHPELTLGGPSMHWLFEALTECRDLLTMDAPQTPTITHLGSNERIVDMKAIRTIMGKWENGKLVMIEGAEHEVLMEIPKTRKMVYDTTAALFGQHK